MKKNEKNPLQIDLTSSLNKGEKIYCRERERESILNFIKNKEKKGLFISGQPGTGKTCLVSKVVEEYRLKDDNMVDIYINCFCFHTFDEFYNKIFESLEEKQSQILKLLQPKYVKVFKSFLSKRNSSSAMRKFLIDLLNEIEIFL